MDLVQMSVGSTGDSIFVDRKYLRFYTSRPEVPDTLYWKTGSIKNICDGEYQRHLLTYATGYSNTWRLPHLLKQEPSPDP